MPKPPKVAGESQLRTYTKPLSLHLLQLYSCINAGWMSCLAWPSIECRTFHIIYEAFHHRCLQQRVTVAYISSGTGRQSARQGNPLVCQAAHARYNLLCFCNAPCIYTTALMHYCKQINTDEVGCHHMSHQSQTILAPMMAAHHLVLLVDRTYSQL